jgi:hypothetical protein
MDKHTTVVIGASIIIAGIVGYSVWNIFAADQIQFQVANQDDFRYFGLINEEKISICNPSPFYTSFNYVKIKLNFEGRDIGELNFPGALVAPNSEITSEGKFTTEVFEEVQYLSMHFDGMFLDAIPQRIDPAKMVINTEVQVQIIGIIPFSVSNQYSALEFWKMMNSNDEYSC